MSDIFSRYNLLSERINGLVVWSMCYRAHPEYWLMARARNEFYGELNRGAALLNGWHQDATRLIGRPTVDQLAADGRLDEAERCFEEADRLWAAERRRVAERRSPTYKRLFDRLLRIYQTPIVRERGGEYFEGYVGQTEVFLEASGALEDFDYPRVERLAAKAELAALETVLAQRAFIEPNE